MVGEQVLSLVFLFLLSSQEKSWSMWVSILSSHLKSLPAPHVLISSHSQLPFWGRREAIAGLSGAMPEDSLADGPLSNHLYIYIDIYRYVCSHIKEVKLVPKLQAVHLYPMVFRCFCEKPGPWWLPEKGTSTRNHKRYNSFLLEGKDKVFVQTMISNKTGKMFLMLSPNMHPQRCSWNHLTWVDELQLLVYLGWGDADARNPSPDFLIPP